MNKLRSASREETKWCPFPTGSGDHRLTTYLTSRESPRRLQEITAIAIAGGLGAVLAV